MKIALFSDIHANLPALEACLRSIDAHEPDAIYCLGDLVGYNIWPNEVIDTVRRRGIPVIAGNYDLGIGHSSNDCGCAYKTELEKEMGSVSISYTNAVVRDQQRAYLRSLPAHLRLEWKAGDSLFQLLMVHGSPRRVNEYLFEDREETSLLRILQQASAHILCFGHTHKPFYKKIWDEEYQLYRHAINIGSVGKPKDGDPRGGYVLLTIDVSAAVPEVDTRLIRFDYDVEQAACGIEQSTLPKQYADMLRHAY